MARSQLKQLKEALRTKGLVGQTNVKKKNRKIAPSETRRDQEERKKELGKIRDEFNRFDQRVNRSKHDYSVISGGKFVKAGSKQHNDTSINKSNVENAMRQEYEEEKRHKNRAGGILDKRFGELDKSLTHEEKMLQRFTKERQRSARQNVFSLGSDDSDDEEEDGGFALTHSGKSIEFGQGADLGLANKYMDEDAIEEPARKKSKKEVMAEIIAKSKFHKKQRQQAFERAQEEIMDLDDGYSDVLGELRQINSGSGHANKTKEDMDYDAKVRELTYERRAVPADRTKTDEEVAKEHEEKMRKLNEDRLKRMSGLKESEAEADDLGDEFWAGSDDEAGEEADAPEALESGSEAEVTTSYGTPKRAGVPALTMPSTHAEFAQQTEKMTHTEILAHTNKLIQLYHPRLAQGNKERVDVFVGILFQHILHISNAQNADSSLVDQLSKTLRTLAERYNEALIDVIRSVLVQVENRVISQTLQQQDLVYFVVLGYCFSTSDHYHLVVTPALILMNQYLSILVGDLHHGSAQKLGQGLVMCEILLSYQSFAKRFDPEVVAFVETCVRSLLPTSPSRLSIDPTHRPQKSASDPMKIQSLFGACPQENEFKFNLLSKALGVMETCVDLWRDKSAAIEVVQVFEDVLKVAARYYSQQLPQIGSMLTRYNKLISNMVSSRKPLTLQEHRKLAIKTVAPKFEENFNPDKKSYDLNRERQELNKMANLIKKEKKLTLKDIRKQTKFVARRQIEEKKTMYSDYHKKMASIVNSISTVEGAEKNQYEKERKRRQNQR